MIATAREHLNPPEFIDVAKEVDYSIALANEVIKLGYCADHFREGSGNRISHDEVAVWRRGEYPKEHWDVVLSTGDTRYPFMVARAFP